MQGVQKSNMTIKQLIREVEQVTERLSNEWPCDDCKRTVFCGACERPGIWMEKSRKKLAQYEAAEEEGRLVVLPCKVGDTVWMVHQRLTSTVNNVVSEMTVTELRGNRLNPIWFVIDGEYGRTSFHPSGIGKTFFFTREEAEKALKEMEGKQ